MKTKKFIIQNVTPLYFFICILSFHHHSFCQLADSPWPKLRHDLQNTGQSNFVGPQRLKPAWKFYAGGSITSSPAIGTDGHIYFGVSDPANCLYILEPDGREKCSVKLGGAVLSSPALDTNGNIYVGSWSHRLFRIDPGCNIVDTFETGLDNKSSPAIGDDGTIYFGSADKHFYALNPDFTLKWKYKASEWFLHSSPAIDKKGEIYAGCWNGNVYAFHPDGPPPIWTYESGGNIQSSPAVGLDGKIYIGVQGRNAGLHAIDNEDGSRVAIFETNGNVFSSPAIANDSTIYVGSSDNQLYAFDHDGRLKWSFPTGGPVNSSPAIGLDGKIYFGSDDGAVYALNPDGSEKWRYSTGKSVRSSPAIGANGQLFIGSSNDTLYAFDGCHQGPKSRPTDSNHHLEDNVDYWGIYCERAPEWTLENTIDPASGDTLLCCGLVTGGLRYSNVHCYCNYDANLEEKRLAVEMSFKIDSPDQVNLDEAVQALEFTINKWHNGKRYEVAVQWLGTNDGGLKWRYWDPHKGQQWIDTKIANVPQLATGDWFTLHLEGEIDSDDNVHYLYLSIRNESTGQDFDYNLSKFLVAPAIDTQATDGFAVAIQLDGNVWNTPYHVFINNVRVVPVPVPVELYSFTARTIDNIVTLAWSTASESNNYGFQIERSIDGKSWQAISFLEGYGTTALSHHYTYKETNQIAGDYYYRLKQIDLDGKYEYSDILKVSVEPPKAFQLEQNYPNPFNPFTTISYVLPRESELELAVFDLQGRRIAELYKGRKPAGYHTLRWDASAQTSGTYFVRMRAGDVVAVRKCLLLK